MEQHTQKDEEEGKKECQFYEGALRSDARPLPHVDRLSSIIKSILTESYNGNSWRRDFFIKQTLPRAVQTLLKRGDLEEEEALHINSFFQEVLGFVCRLIPYDYVEILETLTRLFTNIRCNFYQKYGKDDTSEDYPMYSDDKQQEFTSAQGWETSYFLISNINYFGKMGGFDCIIERLKSNQPSKPNLTIVKHLIKPTFKVREILDASFLQQHVENLLELVPVRVLSLTDEELKNEDKKTISDISRNLEGLVRAAFPNRPCEAIDRFNLDVALKCFRSPYLEKRLAGLNDIKELIGNVRKDEYGQKVRQGSFTMMPSMVHKNDSSIDSPALAQWLRTNNILEQLYGENMHPELVRRCVDIPRFLSSEGMLEDKHLDLIWEASEGKHESICHLIYASIGDLAAGLPQMQIDYLYKKICNIPFSNYSVQTVNLIRSFSFHALHTAMNNQLDTEYGSPILWDLILDATPVSHDVAHQAFSVLTEMLGWNGVAHLRPNYVLMCLTNLKAHNSVVMSLRLLRNLMDMSTPKRKKFPPINGAANVHEAQQTLEILETHDLLTLFFDDLDYFKNSARAALAQLGPSVVNVDVKNTVLVGKFPYMIQIKERLGFLDHVLSTTHFTLSVPQLTTFWNDLVLAALVPEERDEAFMWLERTRALLSQKPVQVPAEDPMFHLFLELVPSLQVDTLSKEGFSFFDFFYRYVNFKLHRLTQTENNKIFIVQDWDLVGLPTLWRIVLEVKDWQVARYAISLLNRSHKNVAPALMPSAGAHLAAYIADCMQYLTSASRDRRELQLQRCLALLLTILEEFETKRIGITPAGARKRHGVCTQGTPMTLNWCMYSGPKSTIVTHSNETFGTIRAKAAQRFDIPYDSVRFISSGQEFKYDSETLGERKVMDGHLITIARANPKVEVDAEPVKDVANLPSTILSQQQYFHQLFDLLTFNETIGKKVWDLLMLLPTNRQMLEELSELSTHPAPYSATNSNGVEGGAVRWEEILDPSSTFKLLYSLQIVDSLLLPNMTYVQGEPLMERAEWRERFIALGGVKHLTTILMNTDFYDHARGSKRKTCLALLLKLVKYFVTEGDQLRFSVLGGCVEPHALVGRLLDIIWGSTGDGHPQTPVPMEEDNVKEIAKPQTVETPSTPGGALPPPPMPVIGPAPMPNGNSVDIASLNFDNINLLPPTLSVEGELVRYAMGLLCAAVITQRELMDRFMSYPHMSRWLYSLSLGTTDESIRTEFTKGLYSLCVAVRNDTQQPHPHTLFLKVLLDFLHPLDAWLATSEQYFNFLNKLVSDSCDGAAGGSTADFAPLLHQLITKISTHPTTETRRGIEEDKVLIGLMCLLNTLVSKDPSFKRIAGQNNTIHEIFENGLFDIPTADAHGPLCPPKCKRRTSRYVAFQLLTELATGNLRNFRDLASRLIKHHEPEERRTQWLYLPSGHEKAACGYVGLKNLGATCYMNSLMQQLYMIPGFRYGIFRTEDDEENKADSLLYQMQVIFGHLQESEKKYYDMQDFCNAYKCDGQPTNTNVQMDVDEFLTMLFDKLERALKKNNILKDFFGGTIINQIISKGCEHVSEREEGFFTLSLEVKDKKHILESLDLYVVGDMLEGDNKYFCGTCSAKVDALKRCCIKTLPNTLIVHAKRFEFDLEAMKRTKLNESLEFPMRLNMEPYTKEGLARIEAQKQDGLSQQEEPPLHPPEYYEYELAGILVHAGTAETGHYYSFVKEREPLHGMNSLQWIYFNDTLVEPFNTDEIPKAAFGGYDTVQQLDSVQGKYVSRTHLRVNNAYMLFYDRVKPTPKAEAGAPPVPSVPVPSVQTPSALVPRPIFNHVWEENMKFLRDKNIFDVDYFSFLWPLVQLKPAPPIDPEDSEFDHTLQCIQLGTRFIVETLAHAKEKASLGDLVTSLKPLYHSHITGSRWFLEHMLGTEMEWPRQLLFSCTTQDTREVFASLVVSVIAGLIEAGERGLYGEVEELDEVDMEELDEEGEVIVHQDERKRQEQEHKMYMYRKPRSLVVRFIDSYIVMLQQAYQHWRYFGQYFLVLRDFALLGTQELRVLLERHVIYQLVDFYLGDDSPQGRSHAQQPRKKMGDKFSQPVLTHMAETLSALVRGCHTRATIHAYQSGTATINGNLHAIIPPTSLSDQLSVMPNEDLSMLYHPILYVKALKEGIHQKSITEIILHLCWEDGDFSHKIIEIIRQAINEVDHDGFKPYFEVFTPLLALADSKQVSRVDEAMTAYLSVIDANFKFKNATLASIRYLVETVQDNAAVRLWLVDHLDEWVDTWLLGAHLEGTRDQAYHLVLGLVGPERDAAAAEIKQRIFMHLLSLLGPAKQHTREDRVQNEDIMSGKSTSAWHLVHYARLLRLFVTGPQERQIFAQHHSELSDLVLKCDQNHYECDENKHELCVLWAHVLQGSPEMVRWAVRNDRLGQALMDYYISIRPGEKFRSYNNNSLPPFYQILSMCCEHEAFLERVSMHRNFDWALRFLFMETGDYPNVAQVLFEIIKKCSVHAKYRAKHLQQVLSYDKLNFCFEHLTRFFDLMLQTTPDYLFFCERKGLEFLMRLFEKEITQAAEHGTESLSSIQVLDLIAKTTEWMIVPATTPPSQPLSASGDALPPSTPTPTTTATPATLTTTAPTLQQRCVDIIHNWQHKGTLLDYAINLFNHPQLSYFDHILHRFNRILEVVCTLDRSFLEQLLTGIHEQLAREDEHLPASLIAHNAGNVESMHRRRLMQHREAYERTNEEMDDAHAYHASTAYNNFLITLINFVLTSPALASPSLVPPPSASTPSTPPSPSTPSPLAPTVIDIAVLTTKNAYVQQRQPYAVKQHSNLQMAILQHQIQRLTRTPSQQQLQETQNAQQPLAQATSFTQTLDLLRKIWDSAQHGPILRENRTLDSLVMTLLIEGSFLLDTHTPALETVALFYNHVAKHIVPAQKEKLLRAHGERTARIVNTCKRDKQAQGSWNFETLLALIQILTTLKLVLTVDSDLKAQFLTDHQPLISTLLETVVLLRDDPAINGTAPDPTPFPRLQELLQLATFFQN